MSERQTGHSLDRVHMTKHGFDARLFQAACGRRGFTVSKWATVTCKRCLATLDRQLNIEPAKVQGA